MRTAITGGSAACGRGMVAPWLVALAAGAAIAPLAAGQVASFSTCTPTNATGTGCPVIAIPDTGVPVTIPLNVTADANGNNLVGRIVAKVWIQHTYQGDLKIELISPAGTVVNLVDRPGTGSPGGVAFGFAAQNFGGFNTSPFGGGVIFYPMRLQDQDPGCGSWVVYDTPGVPQPGIEYTSQPTGFETICSTRYNFLSKSPMSAFAGQNRVGTWQLRVTDLAAQYTGNVRYFGLEITPRTVSTPVVSIASPLGGCVCSGTPIVGSVSDAGGSITSYRVEASTGINGPWTLVSSGSGAVNNGTLGVWNTSAFPAGRHFVRLTATNDLNLSSQAFAEVSVDRAFGALSIRNLPTGSFVRGTICPDGSIDSNCFASYRVDYAPFPVTTGYAPVNPASPVYFSGVSNDPVASWNTTAVPDGTYSMRYTGTTACGNTSVVVRNVTVDNTPPVALITGPTPCGNVCGTVPVTGVASDANLAGWTLQYTGGDARGWVTIASGTSNVNGTLANWNTAGLRRCSYVLRLLVSDQAADCGGSPNSAEYTWPVMVGAYSNCDGSTTTPILNAGDFACFLSKFRAESAQNCPQ